MRLSIKSFGLATGGAIAVAAIGFVLLDSSSHGAAPRAGGERTSHAGAGGRGAAADRTGLP